MRLKMLVGIQIEILGGEILVNCNFKLNRNLDLNLYREISNSTKISIQICTARYWEI